MQDRITVVGNVASIPERRRTGTGDTVVNFRLASNQSHFDSRTGTWVEGEPNWYDVSAYRSLAENALESLEQGQRVIVSGRFRVRKWDTGEKRGTAAEIAADAVGHDLRWGTTVYRRVQGADRSASESTADSSAPEAPEPGSAAQQPSEWVTAAIGGEQAEPALVGAGAGGDGAWAAPGADDTPY